MNSGSEEVLTAMEHQEGNKPESPPLVTSSTQASNTIESVEESTSLQVESTQDSASSTAHCSPVNSHTSMTKNAIPSTLLDNMCHLEFLSSNSAAGILPVNEDDVFMKEEPLEVVATDAVNLSTVTTAITNTDMTAKLPSNKSFTASSCEVETALPVMSDDKLTTVEDEGSIQESMTTNNESNTSVTSSESCDSSKTAYTSAAFTSSSSDGTGSTESVTDTDDDNGDDGDDNDDDDDDDDDNDEDDNKGTYSTSSSTSHYTLVQMYVTNSDNKLDSELSTKTVLPPDAWMYQQLDTATEASNLSATCLDCDSIIGDPEDCQLDVN